MLPDIIATLIRRITKKHCLKHCQRQRELYLFLGWAHLPSIMIDHYASCFLEFMLQKIQLCVKTLGADISSVTFQEFFTQVKQNLR